MFNLTEATISAWLAGFFWPFVRVAALFSAAPIFNYKQAPARFKIAIVVAITLIVMPLLPAVPVVSVFSAEFVVMVMQQLGVGILIGFIMQLVFAIVVFSGQIIAYGMGLGFASMVDPQNGVQVPIISSFYMMMMILLFLFFNVHLVLIEIVIESFFIIPVGTDGLNGAQLMGIVEWGSNVFGEGLLIAMPIAASMLLLNIGMGVVTRAAPQLNIFAVGFPITVMLGLILVWITLPVTFEQIERLLLEGTDQIRYLLGLGR